MVIKYQVDWSSVANHTPNNLIKLECSTSNIKTSSTSPNVGEGRSVIVLQ